MIVEAATFDITLGQEAEFERQFEQAQLVISQSPGYVSHKLYRGLETPGRYLLLVHWQTVEDHTEGFRQGPLFGQWRALIGPSFHTPPVVEHYELKYEM